MAVIPHTCRCCGTRLVTIAVVRIQPLETLQLTAGPAGSAARWLAQPAAGPAASEHRCGHCQTRLPGHWVRWLEAQPPTPAALLVVGPAMVLA